MLEPTLSTIRAAMSLTPVPRALHSNQRPRPCRRRPGANVHIRLLAGMLILLSLLSVVTADGILEAEPYDTPLFKRLARQGQIHYDRREPPARPGGPLDRRQEIQTASSALPVVSLEATISAAASTFSAETSSAISTLTTSTSESAASTASSSSTTTSTTSQTTPLPALPSPFDSSLGSNFTSASCPTFFTTFLSNDTFQRCLPISLLLQNSVSFFQTARSLVALDQTLSTSCAASLPLCQPLMESLASQLTSSSNCGPDLADQNPLVMQAHAGLIAYMPVYTATCLKSNVTGNYCFADAITNAENPSDVYPYYSAIGLNLPAAAKPTCSQCLQEVMSIFAGYAEDSDQPLSTTYNACAQQVDLGCGAKFANSTVAVGTIGTSGGQRTQLLGWMPAVAMITTLVILG